MTFEFLYLAAVPIECWPVPHPAINIRRSATRREELLMSEDELQRVWILRKLLHDMDDIAAIEFILDKLKETKTNNEFFDSMRK